MTNELPADLLQSIESSLPQNKKNLSATFEGLTQRYRDPKNKTKGLLSSAEAWAYVAARLPSTYSVIRYVFAQIPDELPPPTSITDVGCGPGHSVWAAKDKWPEISTASLYEPDKFMRQAAERLHSTSVIDVAIYAGSLRRGSEPADLTLCSYMLNELKEHEQIELIERCWNITQKYMVVIIPGAHRFFPGYLSVRQKLLDMGANIIAPCPNHLSCPINPDKDWCHFSVRVPRSPIHRYVKSGSANHEDEKFSYLVVSKNSAVLPQGRIVKKPMLRKGQIILDVCQVEGDQSTLKRYNVTKKDQASFVKAKKAKWGGAWPPPRY